MSLSTYTTTFQVSRILTTCLTLIAHLKTTLKSGLRDPCQSTRTFLRKVIHSMVTNSDQNLLLLRELLQAPQDMSNLLLRMWIWCKFQVNQSRAPTLGATWIQACLTRSTKRQMDSLDFQMITLTNTSIGMIRVLITTILRTSLKLCKVVCFKLKEQTLTRTMIQPRIWETFSFRAR